jgi:hypothetical protein
VKTGTIARIIGTIIMATGITAAGMVMRAIGGITCGTNIPH